MTVTDDELVAAIRKVMNAAEAHYQDLEATVWSESPDLDRIKQLRDAGDRTTKDWYSVVDLCGPAMWQLQDVGDHWNWPVVVRHLDAASRLQLEAFFAEGIG